MPTSLSHNSDEDVDISLIIVSYNVSRFLEVMLQSAASASLGLDFEIIVVDNNSTDDSVEMVERSFPHVVLIKNSENVGFAAANNQALSRYRGKYACLVNPDVLLQEDTLRTMMDYMNGHPDIGASGCKILNADGSLQLACRRSIPTPLNAFFKLTGLSRIFPNNRLIGAYNMTHLDPDEAADVEAISGSFMFVRREAIDQAGFLDESFFMYGEDLDWLHRIRQSGWRIRYVPQTRVVHYKGESARKNRPRAFVEFYRAMYTYARKHQSTKGVRILTGLVHVMVTVGIVARGGLSMASAGIRSSWLPLIDLATINITPLIATLIRVGHLAPLTTESLPAYLVIHGMYSAIWMSSLYVSGLYGRRRMSPGTAAGGVTAGFVLVAALTYYAPPYAFSRVVILLAWLMNLTVIAGWRLIIRQLSTERPRAIIVGTDKTGRCILSRMQNRSDFDVVGFLDSDPRLIGKRLHNVDVFNGNGKLSDTLDQHKIDEVIVASSTVTYQEILQLVSSCTRLGVGLKLVANIEATEDEATPLEMVSLVDAGTEPLIHIRRAIRRIRK